MRMQANWRAPAETARAHAVVRVRGRVEIELQVHSAGMATAGGQRLGAAVVAWAVVRQVSGAVAYRVKVETAPHATAPAPAPKRRRYRVNFIPPEAEPADGAGARVQLRDGLYRVQLATRRTWADDFAPEWEALRAQFEGHTVSAAVTVNDR